jgi:ribonucleotide monophosphatase NagD (HAD superfamily)
MVGDRLTTDIAGAAAADLKTILVLSGISQREDLVGSTIQPDFIFDDIRTLTEALPLL